MSAVRLADLLVCWSVGPGVNGLTLWQPWASLMAFGEKRIETRSWSTRYRGAVAISASAKWNDEARARATRDPEFVYAWRRHRDLVPTMQPADFPLGAIVAVGRLVECAPTESIEPMLWNAYTTSSLAEICGVRAGFAERVFGGYDGGRYGFVIADLHRVVAPVSCKGRYGFWPVVGETRAALDAAELVAA